VPELPEVETIVADLRPHLTGRTIVRCELIFPTIVRYPEPEVFIDSVAGMQIAVVRRRGKYILLDLQHDLVLVVHLGMTGHLRIVDASAPIEKHTHAIFTLDDGRHLRYHDPRRFGRLLLGTEATLLDAKKMPALGPEPACDAADGVRETVSIAATSADRRPWSLTFRRAGVRWRLTGASPVMQ